MTARASISREQTVAPPDWSEHAHEAIARCGYRLGGARAAVIAVLAERGCATSANELHEAVKADGADVGLASVYRTLELLEELGVAKRVDLGGRGARFEAIGPSGDHHHHMVCEDCGSVVPFEDDDLERALHNAADRAGFTPAAHEVVFQGRCRSCGDEAEA